jgi:hypothetical protein
LKDENGLLSTELLDFINGRYSDNGEYECVGRMDSYLDKLFRYIEKKGKARVLITVIDKFYKKSGVAEQDEYVKWLEKSPKKYSITNIEKIKSNIDGMVAVAVDVDPDSLTYLVASKFADLYGNVVTWKFFGLDPEYQSTITNEELAELNKRPYYRDNQSTTVSTNQKTNISLTQSVASSTCESKLYSTVSFDLMNPCWQANEYNDTYNNSKQYVFVKYINGRYNILSIIPKTGGELVAKNPVTSEGKVGGKKAIVKTWTDQGFNYKRYYIVDGINGWTKCNESLTNSTTCGRVEYSGSDEKSIIEAQNMIDSIKFK